MDELSIITQTILSLIRTKTNFSDSIFNLWFGDLKLLSLSEEKAVFSTPTALRRSILLSKHKEILKECLFEVIGFDVEIEIESVQSDNEIFNTPIKEEKPLSYDAESDKRKEIINKHFGFDKRKITDIVVEYFLHQEDIHTIDFYVNDMAFCIMYNGNDNWTLHIKESKNKIQFGFHEQCCRCRYYR